MSVLTPYDFADLITFTRPTTRKYTNSEGFLATAAIDEPAIDYDPVTYACRGLSIWEARTNLLTYSEQFDNAAWTKTRSSITANATIAPGGTLTADKLVEDTTATATHPVSSAIATLAANTKSTASVYIKAAERTFVVLRVTAGGTNYIACGFNLTTGAVGTPVNAGNGAGATGTISAAGNGFWRCTLTGIHSSTEANPQLNVYMAIGTTLDASGWSYTGDGTSGLYSWGAQLEAGSSASPYIPTTTAQVTRAADVAVINGANFSSWYNQTEGCFVIKGCTVGIPSGEFPIQFQVSDATASNRLENTLYSTNISRFAVVVGGASQAGFDSPTSLTTGVPVKTAVGYKANDFVVSANGGTIATDSSGSIPTVTQLNIGSGFDAGSSLNGWIESIVYYPVKPANSEFPSLST